MGLAQLRDTGLAMGRGFGVNQQEIDHLQQLWIQEHATGRALNIGCGQKRVVGAINLDMNPARWAWVNVTADAHVLPFPDGVFDSVVSSHVIEHLHSPVAALREMARVLHPGGTMAHVIPDHRYTPHQHSKRHTFAHHYHEWCGPDEFKSVMRQVAGMLRVIALEEFPGFRWSFRLEAVRL